MRTSGHIGTGGLTLGVNEASWLIAYTNMKAALPAVLRTDRHYVNPQRAAAIGHLYQL